MDENLNLEKMNSFGNTSDEEEFDENESRPLIRKKNTQVHLADDPILNTNSCNSPSFRVINTPVYDELDLSEEHDKMSCGDRIFNFLERKRPRKRGDSKFLRKFHQLSPYLSKSISVVLVIYSLICIFIFSLNGSTELKWTQTVVSNSSVKQISCLNSHQISNNQIKFLKFQINGPFIDESEFSKNDINSGKYVDIILFKKSDPNHSISNWSLILKVPNKNNEYKESKIISKSFDFKQFYKMDQIDFRVRTNLKNSLPLNYACSTLNNQYENKIVYSIILLVFIYSLIIFELTHRTLAAGLGAIGGISLISFIENEKPTLELIVSWIEWETILLLFGMMIIVAVFCETGLFDLIAVRIFHFAGTRIWLMIGSLCLLSGVLSAFLDNVTTILLLTPITIRLSEIAKLDPRKIIIAEVLFSNIGGASTAIGDPPNVIITANQIINKRGVDFSNFTFHMFAGSIFVYIICFVHFKFMLADEKNFYQKEESELDEMKKEIIIWKRSFQSITPVTKEEKIVKTLLKEKASQLQNLLKQKQFNVKKEYEKTLIIKSQEMLENYKITNKPLLIKCSVIFLGTLILFFLNPFVDKIHLTIGWISILSALLLLSSTTSSASGHAQSDANKSSNVDFEGLMHKVEWSTLLFFGCLFIFMKTIEELGLLNYLGNLISDMIKSVENISDRLAFALLVLVVLSALISSVIDNIPFTTAMIPIIIQLSEQANIDNEK
ncbi:hypothetical protein BpHYR1_030087 [Brachionus plicatilis]|uniref:Citrate transporter-like domain-containing protein n=1 Tax=Brachionus plicatilis TaxID=10195 RepID=A0A3M7QAQ4_BRAPC|nr:hypothetical protein BpHYR1_030087 [Brachionus plicatilis]